MSRQEAVALVTEREGRLCIRLLRRADGTLITEDCWERLRAARRRGLGAFAVVLVLVCLVQFGFKILSVRILLSVWRRTSVPNEVKMTLLRRVMGGCSAVGVFGFGARH